MGKLKQGSGHHIGVTVWIRGETFKAESKTADLWQPKWNETETVLAAAILSQDRNEGPLEGKVAGSWSLGLWSNPRVRAAVDCEQMDVKEEAVVGNACGGEPGSHGRKAILLSHA